MHKITVIIPSFHSKILTTICIKSFVKYCCNDFNINFIVVENSLDSSYKNDIMEISDNILWINNNTRKVGSEANAEAIHIGLKNIDSGLVFVVHCDVAVLSLSFMYDFIGKYDAGYKLIGVQKDMHKDRIGAIHVCGLLTEYSLIKDLDMYPKYVGTTQVMDVGDSLTKYVQDNKIEHYCFRNTINDPSLINEIVSPFGSKKICLCVSDKKEIIFAHLGRGIPKTNEKYSKDGRVSLNDWKLFFKKIL